MFALIDCNNFYASCEEVFCPSLSRYPLLILSNQGECVIALSKKAKELGIQVGEPAFRYRNRKEIRMLSSNFALYADMSDRVMQVLESFAPEMEIYSIDEAFFRMEATRSPQRLYEEGQKIRKKVKQWTGIPISVGIAPSKTLAKLANVIAKKSQKGVCILIDKKEIESVLEQTSPEKIWGIGSKCAKKLKARGIYTASSFSKMQESCIQSTLGVQGVRVAMELRSIVCFDRIEEKEAVKQSILCSRSFSEGLSEIGSLEEAIASFASRAAEKLREQKSLAGCVSVFIRSSPFREPFHSHSSTFFLPQPSDYTPDLIASAKKLLNKVVLSNVTYKKAGVLLADLSPQSQQQPDLFISEMQNSKKDALMNSIDEINHRYRKEVVRSFSMGRPSQWRRSNNSTSPSYTSLWKDILVIK